MDEDYERWSFALEQGTFEEVLDCLEEIVGRLDDGGLTLDQSLRCYELGVLMAKRCEKMLEDAELRISRLDAEELGNDLEDPMDDGLG
jgi:exodeoxyribonuclease VII small subunit